MKSSALQIGKRDWIQPHTGCSLSELDPSLSEGIKPLRWLPIQIIPGFCVWYP